MPDLRVTSLKSFAESPGQWLYRRDTPFDASPAMVLGSAVDCLLLTPSDFESRYVLRPPGIDGRTKQGKLWAASVADRQVVGPEVRAIVEAIRGHGEAMRLLEGTVPQVELLWEQEGLDIIGHADAVGVDRRRIVELKTSQSAAPDAFQRVAHSFCYHWQIYLYSCGCAAMYGGEWRDWEATWIVASTQAPYRVECYRPSMAWMEMADEQVTRELRRFKAHLDADHWPLSSGVIATLDPPRWAWKEED